MPDFLYSDYYLEELGGQEPPEMHSRFAEMTAYLGGVAPEGLLPGRQHIDPLDFHHVISYVILVDVERNEGDVRFRYRLVGEKPRQTAGRIYTGMLVEEVAIPKMVPRITGNMKKVLETRLPVFDSFPIAHPDRQFIDSQRMYYPLAADGQTIDMLLLLHSYDSYPLEAVS